MLRIVNQIYFDLVEFGVKVKSFEKDYTDKLFDKSLDDLRKVMFQIGKAAATKTAPGEKEIQNGSALIQKTMLTPMLTPLTNYLNNKEKKAVMQEYVSKIEEESKNFNSLQKEKRDEIMALL